MKRRWKSASASGARDASAEEHGKAADEAEDDADEERHWGAAREYRQYDYQVDGDVLM